MQEGELPAHITGCMLMDHLLNNVSSTKAMDKEYLTLMDKMQTLMYTLEAVGLENYFVELHNLCHAIKQLGANDLYKHLMIMEKSSFNACRHMEILMLMIHMNWAENKSTDYDKFQKHYNKRLSDLFIAERKVITTNTQHAELLHKVDKLKSKLSETNNKLVENVRNVTQLYENQHELAGHTKGTEKEPYPHDNIGVDTIAAHIAAILKLDDKKTTGSTMTTNTKKEYNTPHKYTHYCYSGGFNPHCDCMGPSCNQGCPCNKSFKGQPPTGRSDTHDITETFKNLKGGCKRLLEHCNLWIDKSGRTAMTKAALLNGQGFL